MTDERLVALYDEVHDLRAENAALVAERDRLRTGLEFLADTDVEWEEADFRCILAGADLRDPAQAEAVRQGTWRMG